MFYRLIVGCSSGPGYAGPTDPPGETAQKKILKINGAYQKEWKGKIRLAFLCRINRLTDPLAYCLSLARKSWFRALSAPDGPPSIRLGAEPGSSLGWK